VTAMSKATPNLSASALSLVMGTFGVPDED
jgi:hypothetical protein